MSLLARIVEEHHGDVAVAGIEGEVDASNAPQIAARLPTLLTNHSVALIVDLTGTTYLDSAGLNLLFELADELRSRQQQLHLVVDPATPIARPIAITGLDAVVPAHATRAAALVAAGQP
jgi:anti-anti-sigma factor